MTLYKQWKELIENQTDETFDEFWKEYSETEKKIYSSILDNPNQPLQGTFGELTEKFHADPKLFMGFLDGIQTSLDQAFSLESIDATSPISLPVNLEALYYNMLAAGADYLYTLPQWETLLSEAQRATITKAYKKTKTVINTGKTGRNDPCPCGSGKKYKHCCGKN